ncbi:Domain of unknown function DUF4214, partial [uncultured Caudovirales phage]
MLPIRAFAPRSGRARGFAVGGMTLEGDGGGSSGIDWANWNNDPGPAPEQQGSVTVTGAPADAGGGGGGGAVDQGTLNQLYEQYLGRGVDESGASNWIGQDINSVIAGITGSQEYANRGGDQGGGGGGGGGGGLPGQSQQGGLPGAVPGQDITGTPTSDTEFVNKLYADVLGRQADSGAQNWINALASGQMTAQDVARSIAGSQEAQQNTRADTDEQRIADAIAAGYGGGTALTPGEAPRVNGATAVADIYKNVLGRAPDPGAQVWIDQINHGANPADVAAQIAASAEAKSRASSIMDPTLAKNDPNNFAGNLTSLYVNALGRAPTAAELNANVNAMNHNPDSFAWIAQQVTGSPDAQQYASKYGQDPEQIYQQAVGSYGHFTPTPEQGGIGGLANKLGPWMVPLAAAAVLAPEFLPALLPAEGAAGAAAAAEGAGALGAGTAAGTTAAAGITGNAALDAALAAAGKGALIGGGMGGISSGLQGGDVLQGVLRGGITGAVGGGLGSGLSGALGSTAGSILGGAGAGAAGAALSGGDIGRGALMGGAGAGLNLGMSAYGPSWAQNPIISNAITGGALTSAMGGNFLKGAEAGALTGAISPYVTGAYNTYFGGTPSYNTAMNPATGLPWTATGSGFSGDAGYQVSPYSADAENQPGGFYGPTIRPSTSYDADIQGGADFYGKP